MGCAASSSATVTTTTARYPVGQTHVYTTQQQQQQQQYNYSTNATTVVIKGIPNAPKSHSRKSSSSSSSSDSVDLNKKRNELKQASAMAAATKEKKVVLSVDILRQYHSLSIVILQLERKNVVQKLEEKMRLSIELKNQAMQLNIEYKQLQLKTQKELRDVQNLESLAKAQNMLDYFQSQVQFDSQMSKEQEEYIQAKTEMEDCYKRLLALQIRQSKMESEIKELQVDHTELNKHYKEQDDILESIFGGSYGSELEEKLEADLDKEQDRKQRIQASMNSWSNAQIYVQSATNQLNYAYARWQSILRIPNNSAGHKMLRVQIAAETRSYLIAASQNLSNSQRLLSKVKFPYCDRNEVATLNKAITYIFIDVQDNSRHSHAGNVYRTTRDRSHVLGQWINKVLTTGIQGDLSNSRTRCADLQSQLRVERTRLMKEKIEEETGETITWEEPTADSGIESDDAEPSDVAAEAENIPESQDLDKQIKEAQEESAEGEANETASVEDDKPMALPLDELAPSPKEDELFGNLEVVMAEYDKQREEYSKEMEANRARQHADFQMKLKARRSRKRRMMAQEQELNELAQKEKATASIEVPQDA
ncbi:uncharacterized protein LOC120345080 isoform X1 [Styela clava]